MSYSIVEGVAENNEVEWCPFCMSDNLELNGDGAITCNYCGRGFYVIEK